MVLSSVQRYLVANAIGLVITFSLPISVQAQASTCSSVSGVCVGGTTACPADKPREISNTLDCVGLTTKCCAPPVVVLPSCSEQGGICQASCSATQFEITQTSGCASATPKCCGTTVACQGPNFKKPVYTCEQWLREANTNKCCSGYECQDTSWWSNTGNIGSQITGIRCVSSRQVQIESTPPQKKADPVYFKPQVTIPGTLKIGGKEFTIKSCDGQADCQGILVTNDLIARYFALFYRFFVALMAIVSVVMIMWGGFKRIMAAGSTETISAANKTIFGALSGLVLTLVSYSLLSLINPNLVSFGSLGVTSIDRMEFIVSENEDTGDDPQISPVENATVISGDNIVNYKGYQATVTVVDSLKKVAQELKKKGYQLVIASGIRTVQRQIEIIQGNCQNPPGSSSCNPKPGRPTTCILRYKQGYSSGLNPEYFDPNSCPHTSGKAVDVWVGLNNLQVISQQSCMSDRGACRQNEGMNIMGKAMQAEGFCNLASEPWHFEKPRMSSRCGTYY